MLVNVTMLTYGRPRLLKQALESLAANTNAGDYNLTALDDAGRLGTGAARNRVIEMAAANKGSYLYLSDLDVFFLPSWLPALIEAYEWARPNLGIIALGAYDHPFNPPYYKYPFYSSVLDRTVEIGVVHGLSTQSWLWRWEDWDRFGPFKVTPPGQVAMGDDVEMSQKIRESGAIVASVYPPLICNTALTNTLGADVVGRDLLEREPCPEGVVRE